MIPTIVAAAALAGSPDGIAFELLLTQYSQLASEVNTLEVIYDREVIDSIWGESDTATCYLWLERRSKGAVTARLDIYQADRVTNTFLLAGTNLYCADYLTRKVLRFSLRDTDTLDCLRRCWLPLLGMLDAGSARQVYQFERSKTDSWHTYFNVLPKHSREKVDWSRIQLVVRNRTTENIPSNVPYRIWCQLPNGDQETITVRSWKINAQGFPSNHLRMPRTIGDWTIPRLRNPDGRSGPLSLADVLEFFAPSPPIARPHEDTQ